MHRHGYKGRKFGRETDQRRALIKGLASELIDHTEITTTLPKAKEVVPYVEKLITKAKAGDLHNRRQIISKVTKPSIAHKLVDEIAPHLTTRNSGHLRITKSGWRKGDNAEMAKISFVDKPFKTIKTKETVISEKITTEKKTAAKTVSPKKATVKETK